MTTNATLDDFLGFNNPHSTDVLTTPFSQVRRMFNGYNENLGGAIDITLTNPLASLQNISFSEAGHKVILPPMDRENSIAPGAMPGIAFKNAGSESFNIVAQDGSTVVYSGITAGQVVFISLKQNQTTNGTFVTQLVSTGGGAGDLLAANNLSDVEDIDISRQNLLAPKTSVHAGDPNSAVAGEVGDFCINTSSSNALYMCTVAGDAASATWTLQGGGGSGDLLAANNLDDVDDAAASLANLGGLSKASNLGDVDDRQAALTNLGALASDAGALIASNNLDDVTDAVAALTNLGGLRIASNLSDLADINVARANIFAPKMTVDVGSPVGNVAGTIGDFYLNTQGGFYLFICTTTGDASTAVWTFQGEAVNTRGSDGPTSTSGAAVLIADMGTPLLPDSLYQLIGSFIVDVGNIATTLTIGVTNDTTLTTLNTLTTQAGRLLTSDTTKAVLASRYSTDTYGLPAANLLPAVVGIALFEINLTFLTGSGPQANLAFWMAATETEGATLKAFSSYTLRKLQ